MQPDWIVEPLQSENDLDEIVAIEEVSFTNPWTKPMLRWEWQNSEVSRLYVLRTPERPVAAYCSCWLVLDELHINNIAVWPACRGQGLGRALLVEVFRLTARSGARRATLEVRQSNEAARRLYDGLGFQIAAVRRNYYTNPVEDALILWRAGLETLRTIQRP